MIQKPAQFNNHHSTPDNYIARQRKIIAQNLGQEIADCVETEQDCYQALKYLSNQKMSLVIKNNFFNDKDKKYANDYYSGTLKKIENGDVESSNIEMLLDLVQEGTLPSYVLSNFSNSTKISKNIDSDLDKLYLAKAELRSVEDTFVPEFEDEKTALQEIKTGEVCKLKNDDFISIKKDEETLLKLKISKKAYLELFPPVEKFIFNQSFTHGDCYFIATLDSINQNPKSRYKLLEMFKENPDGTLDACVGGFDETNSEDFVLEDIENYIEKEKQENSSERISHTCKGLMALEILNEERFVEQAKPRIQEQYKKFKDLRQAIIDKDPIQDTRFMREYKANIRDDIDLMYLNNTLGDNSVFYNSFIYSKDELDFYIDYFENHPKEDTISCLQKGTSILKHEEIEEKLKELENKNDALSNYEKLILKRYSDRVYYINNDTAYISNECMPKEIYSHITGKSPNYSHGGYSYRVFLNAGFEDFLTEKPTEKTTKERLFSPDYEKFLFTCTAEEKRDNSILTNHAYSLEPRNFGEERKFVIRNPHNSVNERVLSYEELCKYFDRITSVEI